MYPTLSPQKVSEGGQGRDELLDGVLQEGEGDVRHGVHDVRHLSGEGQRQHGVQPVQKHSGDNSAELLISKSSQPFVIACHHICDIRKQMC